MKTNLSVYELWFWRIGIVVALFFVFLNYVDNRQQDHLIFSLVDEMGTTTNQLTVLTSNVQVNQEAIISILKN